jgi:hypothetical protein
MIRQFWDGIGAVMVLWGVINLFVSAWIARNARKEASSLNAAGQALSAES